MLIGVGILIMFSGVWMLLCIMVSTPPRGGSLVVYCRRIGGGSLVDLCYLCFCMRFCIMGIYYLYMW